MSCILSQKPYTELTLVTIPQVRTFSSVSYTHLTLPTIYSV